MIAFFVVLAETEWGFILKLWKVRFVHLRYELLFLSNLNFKRSSRNSNWKLKLEVFVVFLERFCLGLSMCFLILDSASISFNHFLCVHFVNYDTLVFFTHIVRERTNGHECVVSSDDLLSGEQIEMAVSSAF